MLTEPKGWFRRHARHAPWRRSSSWGASSPAAPGGRCRCPRHRSRSQTPRRCPRTSPDPAVSDAFGFEPRVALPTRLRIPALGVDSAVTKAHLSEDGYLQPPKPGPDFDKAAWYTGSQRPGDLGVAVIEGHVDGHKGPSVFYGLGGLEEGALVAVKRADGTSVTFRVYAVRTYLKSEFPTAEVYGARPAPELRLITCGGEYDAARKTSGYDSNTVVYARVAST